MDQRVPDAFAFEQRFERQARLAEFDALTDPTWNRFPTRRLRPIALVVRLC